MSMSTTKAALKAAKAALDAREYNDAIDQAKKVLGSDSNNYHAYVVSKSPTVVNLAC